MGDVVPPPGPGWGPPPGPPGLYGQGEVPAIPSPALFPGAPIPGPPTIIPGSSQTTTVDGMLLPKLGRRPHRRRRPVHRCLRKRGRHHDSRRARVGVPPARRAGESRIHLSRVKRLAVVGACLALALTGCSFQGLNSLPLPGAVGRGPDAVTYHVEVAECRDVGVEFAGHDQRRRRRQRRQDDSRRLARQRGDLRQARRRGACQCGSHALGRPACWDPCTWRSTRRSVKSQAVDCSPEPPSA